MLFVQRNFLQLIQEAEFSYASFEYLYLGLAAMMVIPNWLLEAYKWKCGMDSYGTISFRDSMVSIVSGVAVGVITPARVGEYAGRMIVLGKEKYAESVIATFLCSISQLIVTLFIGGIAFMLTFKSFEFEGFSYDWIVYVGVGVFVGLLVVYFNLARVVKLLGRNKWLGAKLGRLVGIENNWLLQTKLFLLSACRYLVYTVQYILVLRFCGIDVASWVLFTHIAMIFFLQSLMPLPPVASFFARTGVALIVLASLDINELVNVVSSMTLWIINLTLPALVGLYFILTQKSTIA